MSVTTLKSDQIVNLGLGQLSRERVLSKLAWLDAVPDFTQRRNDTVTVRIPARLKARRKKLRATGNDRKIVLDNLNELSIDFKIEDVIYSGVPITDEELTLDIVDFGAQVSEPQMSAIVADLEDFLVEKLVAAKTGGTAGSSKYRETVEFAAGSMYRGAVEARAALNDHKVPFGQRTLFVGSAIGSAFLLDEQFVHADKSGDSSNNALREAIIGRVAGFDVVETPALEPDEGFAMHKTGLLLKTMTPKVPDGAVDGAVNAYDGIAMRHIRDYDAIDQTDRSIFDMWVAGGIVCDERQDDATGTLSGKCVRIVPLTFSGEEPDTP